MKIAIISLYLPSGSKIGVGYQVHYLANELVKRGHQVTVFSQTGASNDSLYKVVIVPCGKNFRTFSFAWTLRKYDFAQFDVLNTHGDDWFLWGCKRPRHIHTFHGSCFAEMLHAKGFMAKLRMAMLAFCEYTSCFLADELVAVSENTRRYIPMAKRVIYDGVDPRIFFSLGEKSLSPTILFVGTMHGRKRGKMLLDIFENRIRPVEPKAEFWAVCGESIERQGVRWFGKISTAELADLYRRAWVFCLPSTYEGFGVPYVEAMASGTAVVASPNLGAQEVLQDGKFGLIASDDSLARVLLSVLRDSALRSNLQQLGLERARFFFWDLICQQYEALFQCDSLKNGDCI